MVNDILTTKERSIDRSERWLIFAVLLRTGDEGAEIATELSDHGDDADRFQRRAGIYHPKDANEDIEWTISCCLASRRRLFRCCQIIEERETSFD